MIPRMRIAKKIVEEIRELDPNTGLNESNVRRLAKEGSVQSVQVGNRLLINLDSVIEFLSTPPPVKIVQTRDEKKRISSNRINEYKKNIGIK